MKSILKGKHSVNLEKQSNSIAAVRWTLTDENVQAHSSAPIISFKSSAPSTRSQQKQQHRQQGLRDLRSLQECVRFINHWKDQVAQVCKKGGDLGEGTSQGAMAAAEYKADSRTERSLEESHKLILQWADELNNVDMLSKDSPWMQERFREEDKEEENQNELVHLRIMEWAKEIQSVSESNGMLGEELGQTLRLLGLRKKKLVSLMPLLELITWSLLKEDSKGMVPQLWLSAKQRTWKAGIPRYIPNSAWSWICSAADDVTLDPITNHPWLTLSDDGKKVQEGLCAVDLPDNPQRFDGWPCVLGWQGFQSGRHYWEVDLANNGYWRVGVTTASSQRSGRFAMTPAKGYWVLWRSTRQFYACAIPEAPLPPALVPRRMGVYLDYEEGQISFYNAESKSHIYTFTGNFREKLYPLFAPLDGRTLITVSSPKGISTS